MNFPININTPIVNIETSIYKDDNNAKFALYLYPSIPFSHQNIPENVINIFIALDISGSMNCDIPNINNDNSNNSRYTCSVKSLRPLLNLFRKFVSVNKQVFVWIYAFNSNVYPIIENYNIINTDQSINTIIQKCEDIYPRYGTDIGNVIKRIEIEKTYLQVADNIRTISILLSDGFTNGGLSSDDIIKSHSKFFDATIGIGEDNDYDSKLLTAISKENRVRGCMTSDDIYDQLISAIFNDFEIYASKLIINIANDIKLLDSNQKYDIDSRKKIYFNKLRFSQPLIMIFDGCPHSINFQFYDVKNININEYEEAITHLNMEFININFSKLNNTIYDIDISLSDESTNLYDTSDKLNIGEFNTIISYLELIKEFNSFDTNNRNAILSVKNKLDELLPILLKSDTRFCNMAKTILTQIKFRVDILFNISLTISNDLDEDNPLPDLIPHYDNKYISAPKKKLRLTNNFNSPLTPSQTITSVNIMRQQAGNYASLSRELSEAYSQDNNK
jgi:hypothetical protein